LPTVVVVVVIVIVINVYTRPWWRHYHVIQGVVVVVVLAAAATVVICICVCIVHKLAGWHRADIQSRWRWDCMGNEIKSWGGPNHRQISTATSRQQVCSSSSSGGDGSSSDNTWKYLIYFFKKKPPTWNVFIGFSVADWYFATTEEWKAELSLVLWYILRWFTCLQTVSH